MKPRLLNVKSDIQTTALRTSLPTSAGSVSGLPAKASAILRKKTNVANLLQHFRPAPLRYSWKQNFRRKLSTYYRKRILSRLPVAWPNQQTLGRKKASGAVTKLESICSAGKRHERATAAKLSPCFLQVWAILWKNARILLLLKYVWFKICETLIQFLFEFVQRLMFVWRLKIQKII